MYVLHKFESRVSFMQTDSCFYYNLIEIFAGGFPVEYVMHS